MTSTSEARRVVQETIKQLGGLDLIISNAVGIQFCNGVLHQKNAS